VSHAWRENRCRFRLFGFREQFLIISWILPYSGCSPIWFIVTSPPIPARVLAETRSCLPAKISSVNECFSTFGIIEYGSVYGHGAYLGSDFTAKYLHNTSEFLIKAYSAAAEPYLCSGSAGGRYAIPTRAASEPKPSCHRSFIGTIRNPGSRRIANLDSASQSMACSERHVMGTSAVPNSRRR
jgi:hypothetical protein